MKKSPMNPKYETTAYQGDGFDPHVDFSEVIILTSASFFLVNFLMLEKTLLC